MVPGELEMFEFPSGVHTLRDTTSHGTTTSGKSLSNETQHQTMSAEFTQGGSTSITPFTGSSSMSSGSSGMGMSMGSLATLTAPPQLALGNTRFSPQHNILGSAEDDFPDELYRNLIGRVLGGCTHLS